MKRIFFPLLFMFCSTTIFAEQTCRGLLEDISISSNIHIVGECKLARVKVEGNIILKDDSSLKILNSEVKGNVISASSFKSVEAINNAIQGNINLNNGQNTRLLGNSVNGNVQLKEHLGKIFIQNNRIDGNLKCVSNSATPEGGQNYVKGDKEQQCISL